MVQRFQGRRERELETRTMSLCQVKRGPPLLIERGGGPFLRRITAARRPYSLRPERPLSAPWL